MNIIIDVIDILADTAVLHRILVKKRSGIMRDVMS